MVFIIISFKYNRIFRKSNKHHNIHDCGFVKAHVTHYCRKISKMQNNVMLIRRKSEISYAMRRHAGTISGQNVSVFTQKRVVGESKELTLVCELGQMIQLLEKS